MGWWYEHTFVHFAAPTRQRIHTGYCTLCRRCTVVKTLFHSVLDFLPQTHSSSEYLFIVERDTRYRECGMRILGIEVVKRSRVVVQTNAVWGLHKDVEPLHNNGNTNQQLATPRMLVGALGGAASFPRIVSGAAVTGGQPKRRDEGCYDYRGWDEERMRAAGLLQVEQDLRGGS